LVNDVAKWRMAIIDHLFFEGGRTQFDELTPLGDSL